MEAELDIEYIKGVVQGIPLTVVYALLRAFEEAGTCRQWAEWSGDLCGAL